MCNMSTVENNLITKVNKLTRYLSLVSVAEIILAFLAIISAVGFFGNWRLGHETAFEGIAMKFFLTLLIIWLVLWVVAVISLVVIAVSRGREIKKLVAMGSSKSYDHLNMSLVAFATLPIIAVVIIALIEIIKLI